MTINFRGKMLKYRDGEEQVYSRDWEPKTQVKYINPNTKYIVGNAQNMKKIKTAIRIRGRWHL